MQVNGLVEALVSACRIARVLTLSDGSIFRGGEMEGPREESGEQGEAAAELIVEDESFSWRPQRPRYVLQPSANRSRSESGGTDFAVVLLATILSSLAVACSNCRHRRVRSV